MDLEISQNRNTVKDAYLLLLKFKCHLRLGLHACCCYYPLFSCLQLPKISPRASDGNFLDSASAWRWIYIECSSQKYWDAQVRKQEQNQSYGLGHLWKPFRRKAPCIIARLGNREQNNSSFPAETCKFLFWDVTRILLLTETVTLTKWLLQFSSLLFAIQQLNKGTWKDLTVFSSARVSCSHWEPVESRLF